MTEEQALKLASYVLHHEQGRYRSGEIVAKAMNAALRQMWVAQDILLPWDEPHRVPDVSAKLTRLLKKHVENASPARRQVDGNANGWKLGARAGSFISSTVPTLQVTDDRALIGLAGEYAVMSELLALGWNVAKPPFDNGVDLFATRGGEIRTVQVKTATLTQLGDGTMSFTGSVRAHDDYNNVRHYYVLVMRTMAGTRWQNNFYVSPSLDFSRVVANARRSSDGTKWTVTVNRASDKFLMDGQEDITPNLDRLQERFR